MLDQNEQTVAYQAVCSRHSYCPMLFLQRVATNYDAGPWLHHYKCLELEFV